MKFNKDETIAILNAVRRVEQGEVSKLKAYIDMNDEYKRKVKQSNFFALVDKLLVLSRLKQLYVDAHVIDEIAQQMNIYYIWRLYNDR